MQSDFSTSSGQQAIGPYLRAVRRHWILVPLLTLLAGAAAAYTVHSSGYTYKATADVLVSPLPSAPNYLGLGLVTDTGDPTRNVQTAAALLDTAQAASATAAKLGNGWSTDSVQKAVTIDALGQTDVLAISGSASSPGKATRLTNAYTNTALQVHGQVVQANLSAQIAKLKTQIASSPAGAATSSSLSSQLGALEATQTTGQTTGGDPTLRVSQAATAPTSHTGASHSLIILLGFIGGFAIASIAALGLDFFGRPVKDVDDLEALFPAPVLASVPKVGYRGHGPLSPWMFPPAAFEQVRMLRVQLDLMVRAPVIMVTSAGSGDGKTTLVAALAAAFGEGGRDVIVLDLDLHRPSLAKVLDVELPRTGNGADPGAPPGAPAGALIPVPKLPRVKLLPLPKAGDLTPDELMVRLPILLAQAQRAAECVILDSAPIGQISESLRIAAMSGAVVFVARPGHTDSRLLIRSRDLLARSGVQPAGVVLVGQPASRHDGDYYSSAPDNGAVRVGSVAPPSTFEARLDSAELADERAAIKGGGAEADEPS